MMAGRCAIRPRGNGRAQGPAPTMRAATETYGQAPVPAQKEP